MTVRIGLILLFSFLLGACMGSGNSSIDHEAGTRPSIVWPPAPEPARIEFLTQFHNADELGLKKSFFSRLIEFFAGPENRQLSRPYAVSVNEHKVAVADPDAATVHVFDSENNDYERLTKAGGTQFVVPIAVALSNNRIFIADSGLNRVFILNSNFKTISILEDFKRPTGLAFDTQREILYVTDTLAHQVKVFDRDGDFLFSIGGNGEHDGQFNYPSHLAFHNDRLFVNDTMNFRIQIFQHDGKHLGSFGKQGDATGSIGQAKGVAIDPDGHVYVADALSSRIQIFDQDGRFLLDFGDFGNRPGYFQLPAGMTFWKNKIYIADSYNRRIQVFRYLGEGN